jgi:hypothetical protein
MPELLEEMPALSESHRQARHPTEGATYGRRSFGAFSRLQVRSGDARVIAQLCCVKSRGTRGVTCAVRRARVGRGFCCEAISTHGPLYSSSICHSQSDSLLYTQFFRTHQSSIYCGTHLSLYLNISVSDLVLKDLLRRI